MFKFSVIYHHHLTVAAPLNPNHHHHYHHQAYKLSLGQNLNKLPSLLTSITAVSVVASTVSVVPASVSVVSAAISVVPAAISVVPTAISVVPAAISVVTSPVTYDRVKREMIGDDAWPNPYLFMQLCFLYSESSLQMLEVKIDRELLIQFHHVFSLSEERHRIIRK